MRGVALGGFMGVGKTAVGRRLASVLGLPFVDLDAVLSERHGSIARQFEEEGEPTFRAREAALIRELDDGVARVLATGGGAWVDAENRRRLGRRHVRVVLSAPVDVLRARVGSGSERPLWDGEVEARLRARAGAYADADLRVDTGELGVDEVVEHIAGSLREQGRAATVRVDLGERGYDVRVGPGGFQGLSAALDEAGIGPDVVVVVDREAGRHHSAALDDELRAGGRSARWLEPAHGEANKTLATWRQLVDGMLAPGFHRKTAVLALGGGVAGDLAGFAAATVMRGVPFVQVPTTLLAMVDSSVGGKTGVNHPTGKNLVGAFYQPRLVWAGLGTLDTLPREELRCGLVEALKMGVIADPELVDRIETHGRMLAAGAAGGVLADVVARCVRLKAEVVAEDEREAGRRAVLNLGHTLAHGLETALGGATIRHGEAVAIGLVQEAAWAVREGVCSDSGLPARLARILASFGLPSEVPMTDRDAVNAAMRLDKKASSDSLSLPVPVRAGSVCLVSLPIDRVGELLSNESA